MQQVGERARADDGPEAAGGEADLPPADPGGQARLQRFPPEPPSADHADGAGEEPADERQPDAGDDDTVKKAGYVDLGSLKGNIGDQNYDIPSDIDLGKYRAATIWCNRFSVNFATAPLTMPGRPS